MPERLAALTSLPEEVTALLDEYAVTGVTAVTATPSEIDRTWLVDAVDGPLVLKRSPHGSSASRMQAGLLAIAATDADLPVPALLTSRTTGAALSADGTAFVSTRLPGVPLEDEPLTEGLVREIARLQARLSAALASADPVSLLVPPINDWSLDAVVACEEWIDDVIPAEAAAPLRAAVAAYRDDVLPVRAQLPAQVIHADFNLSNLLIADGAVSGIIDFGDAIHAPRVYDVAVTACYLALALGSLTHPLLEAYLDEAEARLGLAPLERRLIPTLVRCRLVIVLVYSRRAARLAPARADYILRYDRLAEHLLDELVTAGDARRERGTP